MKFEYLFFNILILASSLIGPWLYPGGVFPKKYPAMIAIGCVATFFIVWDMVVTNVWWRFNDSFILGIKLGNLPLEEVLFFFIVPWGCLVLWENAHHHFQKRIIYVSRLLFIVPLVFFLGISLLYGLWYTASVCFLMTVILSASFITSKTMIRLPSIIFWGMVFCLTLIFNGYLTARPVVTYDSSYI
ncbi:MAG: lycopene cyclase domain-containing protein, partial [Patescibacteria group bacterium]|nr:lycopene cyclase domain-containing protein [Patescibacteria group bacterium]